MRAFGFFGGVTAQIVSDNLKAGVTKACFYDPAINRTYADMATHYGTALVPARPHKPKGKVKVEGAVLLVELDPGAAAQSTILQPWGRERCHSPASGPAQRQGLTPSRGQPQAAVRPAGQASPEAAAGGALRLC